MATLNLIPNATGTYSNLTVYGGDTYGWEAVNDPIGTPDDDTTYVANTTSAKADTYNMPNHTTESGVITNVRVYLRAKKVSGGEAQFYTRTHSTDYPVTATINYSWADYYHDYANNPNTSSAWTWTEIDDLEIGVNMQYISGYGRCTQVYAVVTYTPIFDATKDVSIDLTIEQDEYKDASVDLNLQHSSYNLEIGVGLDPESFVSVNIEIERYNYTNTNVGVNISNPENLELCIYDSVNNRWTNGSTGGVSKRYIKSTSKLIRKEAINKLSELSFDLLTNDSDLYIEKGDIIALGTEFAWVGSAGSSDSLFNEHLLFEGVVTSVKKSIKVKVGSDYIQTYKVIALHVVHTLSYEYKQLLITTKKVRFGGEEIITTPYYNIKELLEDMVYYDKDGNTVTADNLPIYVRNCGTYLKHAEYTDKNKLEILLDLCSKSPNIFYCHNDGFYFEPQKPSLSTAYFNKEGNTQNYHNINYDAGFPIEDRQDLTDNNWDSPSGQYIEDSWIGFYHNNVSPYNQTLYGLGVWILATTGYTYVNMDYASVTAKSIGSLLALANDQFDTTVIGWQRNEDVWSQSITAKNDVFINFKPQPNTIGYSMSLGISRPSSTFNPFITYTNNATPNPYWIFRSGFSPAFYVIMNDQIRYLNPSYPARMMINPDDNASQSDAWVLQGYNPITGLSMLSTIGLTTAETKSSDTVLYSDPIWMFNRDYTLLTGLSNVSNLTSDIDDDDRLINWHDTIKSFAIEVEMVNLALDTSSRTGVILNLDFAGNGIKDYIKCIVYYTGSSIAMKHSGFLNGVEQSTRINYKLITTQVYTKFRLLYNFDGISITNTKFQLWDSVAEEWYEETVGWFAHHVDVVESGNGIGIIVENTYKEQGIKNVHCYIINEYNKTIDMDLSSKVTITEPNIKGQYIVIGEKSDLQVRIPIGKYPDVPDTDGDIKIITKKVENNTTATAMARQLYEKDNQKTLQFTYHESYLDDTTTHSQIKPNKMISFDSEDYFVFSFDTTFMDQGCTSKVKAGYDPKNYFIMVYEKTEESTPEQAAISAPIEVVYETEDLGGEDILDGTPVSFPDNYFTRTDF